MAIPELPKLAPLATLPGLTPNKPLASAPTGKGNVMPLATQQIVSDPTENPLENVEYTGDLETDSRAELEAINSAASAGIKDNARRERENKIAENDTEYWFCVCFLSRQQKDEFLEKTGWQIIGNKYLSGSWLAERMGIELTASTGRAIPQYRIDKKWAEMAQPLPPPSE